ncbi:MAG TPA: prolyl oligopeptidase family serine peptidase, partial [Gemmatimonadaceae bacterium]|nr:prolyl oligopeptidase family serine peptidase [Gemmatimonadaceae bacterium]
TRRVVQAGGTAKDRKVLELEDFAEWNRIASPALSRDGKWMTFTYSPNEGGQATLHVKSLDGGPDYATVVGPGGDAAGGGRGGAGGGNTPSFSDDSHWAAYLVTPQRAAGRGTGRGARGGVTGAAASAPTGAAAAHLELLNLRGGDKVAIPGAASWKFAKGSRWLAVKLAREGAPATATAAPAGGRGGRGGAGGVAPVPSDLVVRDMASGAARNIGNVADFEFDNSGTLLAYTVEAPDRLGNGLYLLDPASGETRALSTAPADFAQPSWSDDRDNLAVLRGDTVPGMTQKANALLAWTGVKANSAAFTYDPSKDPSFPSGMVLSEYTAPRWSPDGSRLFVGIKAQEPQIAAADSNKANVDIWHWKDQMPQSVQAVQVQQLRRATLPAVISIGSHKLVRLGDDSMRTVTPTADGRMAIGRDDGAYRGEVAWGANRADLYRVDVATGARTLIDKALSRTYGTSPDSRWFVYLKNKQVRAFSLESGTAVTLDATALPTKSYVNEDDDHAYELPVWGVGGWSKDGRAILLYDKFDVWQVPLDGGKATNLTGGAGRAQGIQFRVVQLAAGGRGGRGGGGGGFGGGGIAPDTERVDLAKPVTLSAYGTRSKKFGYWQVLAGQAPHALVWADRNVGGAMKAADADRIVYTEQDFNEFPDYWATTSTFAAPARVTDANPILAGFAWASRKVLIDYKDRFGHPLQATLTLPAGYQAGKQYPMLVEFYEIMSNTHHNFPMPGYADSPQISMYASNGYAVLQPDVVYEIGKPGTSAVDCITSAVKQAIALGYADPKHIGLHGHSWGGYQSSYIVTQTDLFAAVVTGAPPTNLTSFYDELYKSTGTVQQGITTVGQVRLGVGVDPWTNTKMFEDQSPIFHVKSIHTPFMILQGGEDNAVDYVEGLQFFNAARQQGKQVIFLSYPGQPHNLTDRADQKDFAIRMKQFFDHYLMGTPMPRWMADGLPQTEKGGPIR